MNNEESLFADLSEEMFMPAPQEILQERTADHKEATFFSDGIRRLLRNRVATASLFLIVFITVCTVIFPALWPYRYDERLGAGIIDDPSYNNLSPFEYGTTELQRIEKGEFVFPHIFGTDEQGRDYFIRVIYGTRISLLVGFFASIIVLLIGLIIGSLAGYLGGITDTVIMRIIDIIYSLPDMLMVILLASVLNQAIDLKGTFLEALGTNIISLFLVFATLYWVSMARLIRGQILSLRETEYVLCAKLYGASGAHIIKKHLLPNCVGVIIISTALQIPGAIFTESYLSFLGLGVNAPMPSLGSLASAALDGIRSYPYRLIIPAAVISVIVLSLNLLGDGLRDAFDPKLKGR